jgi:hypothetical protein
MNLSCIVEGLAQIDIGGVLGYKRTSSLFRCLPLFPFALKGMAGINQNNQRSQSLCEVEIGRRGINIDTVEAHRLGDG